MNFVWGLLPNFQFDATHDASVSFSSPGPREGAAFGRCSSKDVTKICQVSLGGVGGKMWQRLCGYRTLGEIFSWDKDFFQKAAVLYTKLPKMTNHHI
jgi:hypothetical protein